MSVVECITLAGHTEVFHKDRLILRPAAYALIAHDEKLLLLKMGHTGKYHLPGGGIQIGERMEETGVEMDVMRFTHFEEVFFYYDPSDRAYHGLHFYFICRPKMLRLLADDQIEDESAGQPRWMEIIDLHPEDFQYHGDAVLELCNGLPTQFPLLSRTAGEDDR